MPDYLEIYAGHAAEYDALVDAEDCDGHVLPAISTLCPLAGARVLEVGAGTGRLTRLLAGAGATVVATERSPAMAERLRRRSPGSFAILADARSLPVSDGWADLAVAGWVLGHFRSWMPETWRAEIGRALDEMRRTVRPGGTVLLIETLGTGQLEARPPSPGLDEYYGWLEGAHGMRRTTIRTDYAFPTVEIAADTAGFFFGPDMARRIRENGWARIPEHTGLWSKTAG